MVIEPCGILGRTSLTTLIGFCDSCANFGVNSSMFRSHSLEFNHGEIVPYALDYSDDECPSVSGPLGSVWVHDTDRS